MVAITMVTAQATKLLCLQCLLRLLRGKELVTCAMVKATSLVIALVLASPAPVSNHKHNSHRNLRPKLIMRLPMSKALRTLLTIAIQQELLHNTEARRALKET